MLLGQAGISLGSPGVAPGLHRLRIGCTVCQYAEPVKNSLRVVPPHRFLLMREASCCWTTERKKSCSGENRTHYLLVMSQAACHLHLAADKTIHPPDLHRPSVRYRRTAALSLLGWSKMDTHPGLAPGKIGFADRQLVDFAICVKKIGQVRGTRTHPAGFTGLNAAGYIIT